ncbi:FtsX-like permease family protein [Paenibacillus sp. LMG 31456]|uniref:FtsX-like permease family protein n=1 Tax=Paenibacillus foliorum TaxID=2654974 RepID=A0A972GRX3_9BACL|nr:ABC transporter permease [Paenibacillus foliorum]NOU91635.1 FtsX-like permease family protein [Paenibacillus foliorum]
MNFRQFAVKNVRGNWHQYRAFFLSSVFSVMIFFIYAAFIFHPDVINGHIQGASGVRMGMLACEYIIMIFSFFFVLYSNSAFLKSRKKEFGLLSLFGMTTRQIYKMVVYENIFISVIAIAVGIGFGALFSKLFFMAMSELLQVGNPISFYLAPKALITTAAGFFLLFQMITLVTLFQIRNSQIIDLIRAAKKPKTPPAFSIWLVLLSVICLGTGYTMAYFTTVRTVLFFVLPVIFLVTLGTYFLFTQCSVAIFHRLQRTLPIYYNRTNLITISQLVFKMKDNARVLFIVAILSAVILSASGTFYVIYQGNKGKMVEAFPHTVAFAEKGANVHRVIDLDKLNGVLQQDGVRIEHEMKLLTVPLSTSTVPSAASATIDDYRNMPLLVSEDAFNREAARYGNLKAVNVERGHAVTVTPNPLNDVKNHMSQGDTFVSRMGDQQIKLLVDEHYEGNLVSSTLNYTGFLVADQAEFEEILRNVPANDTYILYGYELHNWENAGPTVNKIEQLIPKEQQSYFVSRVESYLELKQVSSLTLFIGLFVSFLFFVASGSMIYFRLFTELQEDQALYKSLIRIGVSIKEITRITTLQIGMIFFIPCLVGVVHALFAFRALGNVLSINSMLYGFVVIAIYIMMQGVYFFITRRQYLKHLTRL